MKAINESELVLGKMTDEEEKALVAKQLQTWQNFAAFWRPALDKGKKCWDYVVGDILTEKEKADLRAKDKLILQIPELIPQLNAILGDQIKQARPGMVVSGGSAEDAPDATVADTILKIFERENDAHIEYSDTYKDAMVTSFPQFIFIDKHTGWAKNRTVDIYHEAWDSVLPDPNFSRYDLSDCSRIVRVKTMTKAKILEKFPDRKDVIEKNLQNADYTSESWGQALYTSEERNILFNSLKAANEMFTRSGLIYVIENLYFCRKNTTIYISEYSEEPEILPESWKKSEIAEWRQDHPDYKPVSMDVDIYYVTTVTSTGALLEHGPHWYQKEEFHCEMLIPQMFNNKPVGMVEFLLDNAKLGVYGDIEHIHSVRLANDNLMVVKEGALVNAEDAVSEKARAGGVLIRSEDSEPTDIEFPINRREQAGYAEMKRESLETANRIGVSPSFAGNIATSQQSGKSVEALTRQTQGKFIPAMNNTNAFIIRMRKKILKMMPSILTEYYMFRYMDDKTKQEQNIEVNVPMEYDWTGAVRKLHNNLAGAKYDYIPTFGDDSISGKEQELNNFNEIMRNVMATIPQDAWPIFLTSVPNRLANEFGQRLFEQQQNQKPPEDPMRLSLSLSGDDILYNPAVQTILKDKGVLPPDFQAQPINPKAMSVPAVPTGASQVPAQNLNLGA